MSIGAAASLWWVRREFGRVDRRIDVHDECADGTSKLIAKMSTDIAVTRESLENLEVGMSDIKTSISDMNRTIIDKLTR